MIKYFKDIFSGIWNLLLGMQISMRNFIRPKTTEPYPENRETHHPCDRFRGELTLIHDENNEHKCTACGLCATNCPNQTINVTKTKIVGEDGKPKILLDKYEYDLGSCIFCGLCTRVCPQGALEWNWNFEHAVFTRSKLVKQLNKPGSKRKEPARPAAAPVSQQPAAKTADANQNKENNQQ